MSAEAHEDERARVARFAPRLLRWFETDGRRGLPWQSDPAPYRVWVSEIMLQQTQVTAAIPYFEAFMGRFPDLQSLAAAPIDEVLHLWSGLGYYARARNLHRAARAVVTRHGGVFPVAIEEVVALPGIGRSTAGAILALSGGARHPILDGNVRRVLARQFGVEGHSGDSTATKRLWGLADACTPQTRVAEYTQAIMDLGATVCTRSRPACLLCPVGDTCVARATSREHELPTPRPRAARPVREAWLVIAMRGGHKVLLERRPPSGIWGGLWGLPEFPTRSHALQWCGEQLSGAAEPRAVEPMRHAFSHFEYEMHPLLVHCLGRARMLRDDDRFRWYDARVPAKIGLARPIATLVARATAGEDER